MYFSRTYIPVSFSSWSREARALQPDLLTRQARCFKFKLYSLIICMMLSLLYFVVK